MVDASVFDKIKTLQDYDRLEQEFEFKKSLMAQNAIKGNLETQVLQQSIANGGISPEKLLGFQIQLQNHQDALANQKETREANQQYRTDSLNLQREKIEDKKDLKFRNDQNNLTGILTDTDNQIAKIQSFFGDDGKLKPEVAAVYGTTAGYQLPYVHQGTIDAKVDLDNVINNSIFQKLGELKSQSATGASGLGSLSNSEGAMLKSSATAAGDYKQSQENAEKNLKAYLKQLQTSRANFEKGFQNIYGAQAGIPSPNATIDPGLAAELARRGLVKK